MTNRKISEIFRDIAAELELAGENPYRVRAYRRAASALLEISEPLEKLARAGRIRSIPGIGKDLERKILDFLETGKIRETTESPPSGSGSLTNAASFSVPGLDPKIMRLLRKRFRMETREDLENLARSRLLRTLPEFGFRIEKLILNASEKRSRSENEKRDHPGGPP